MSINILAELDSQYIWHPFTQHGLETEFLPVVKGIGAWLELSDGRRILDAVSSWWVNLHGHAHPTIAKAIYDQACQLEQVIFAGFTHQPGVRLAEILVEAVRIRGTELQRCFYSDNGSTSVEVAMKMAYQYHKNQGNNARTRFLALNNSYHGDTLGGMSLSARDNYHRYFTELLADVDFVPTDDITALKNRLAERPNEYAAMIVEPMVQAAGGMQMYSANYLKELAGLCKENDILLICDEVFTGFYRTGKCFAFEHAGIKPDLICLSKGLTGGFLPLGVTLTTEKIFQTFLSKEVGRAFFHSHSYTANPLACAAAIASWELLQQQSTHGALERIGKKTQQWLEHLNNHSAVDNTRCLGTIGALELKNGPSYFSAFSYNVRQYALSHGVLLRPLGKVLYVLPPYCTEDKELDQMYSIVEDIVNQVAKFL